MPDVSGLLLSLSQPLDVECVVSGGWTCVPLFGGMCCA